LILVILFGFISIFLGGLLCALIFLLFHGKKKLHPSISIYLFIFVAGFVMLGKLLVDSDALSVGNLMILFFITFVPAYMLTSLGLSKYKS